MRPLSQRRLPLPDVFAALPISARRTIDLRRRRIAAGELIFLAGEPSEGLVVVLAGTVELVSASGVRFGTAGAGDLLGEIGFLLGQPRSASARAGDDGAEVGEISAREVERLLAEHPAMALELSRSLSRKLVTTNDTLAKRATKVALLIGDVGDLLARLAGQSSGQIGIVSLDGAPKPPRRKAFTPVEPDEVLAHLRRHEASLRDLPLVIVHAGSWRDLLSDVVAPVADWVVAAPPLPPWVRSDRTLLVEDEASLARALRWMTGRAIGVCLSSGGSKTVAHVGVLAALTEAGVPIDALVGCSGGSAIGSGYLVGGTTEEIADGAARLGAVLSGGRFDVAVLPRVAQAKAERVGALLEDMLGPRSFDELAIPAAMVATDLASGDRAVLREGSLSDAVRASMAIPGLLPPFRIGERWYADGAVVDPVPVAALREMGVGTVIASVVAGRGNRAKGRERGGAAPGKQPGLLHIISSVITAGEAARVASSLPGADIVIAPEVDAKHSFDFSDVDGKIAAGRAAADEVLTRTVIAR